MLLNTLTLKLKANFKSSGYFAKLGKLPVATQLASLPENVALNLLEFTYGVPALSFAFYRCSILRWNAQWRGKLQRAHQRKDGREADIVSLHDNLIQSDLIVNANLSR